jgi:hypothetical protein
MILWEPYHCIWGRALLLKKKLKNSGYVCGATVSNVDKGTLKIF